MSDTHNWAEAQARNVIETCRIEAMDGTVLFTPDGEGHYGALCTRDFAYLVEHGGREPVVPPVQAALYETERFLAPLTVR